MSLLARNAHPRYRVSHYDVHGLSIAASSTDENLLAAVDELLSPFLVPASASDPVADGATQGAISIRIEPASALHHVPEGAHLWLELSPIRLSVASDAMYLELDGTCVARLSGDSRIDAWIPAGRISERWTIAHYVLQPLLMEALRTHGLMMIHAAALADAGRVALFPAASGSGKTTLTLALLRAGFRLLSDDSPFLRVRDQHLEVCAFPERVNVMEHTCRLFPELRPYWLAGAPDPHRAKRPIDATLVYGNRTIANGVPSAVIFPEIGEDETSALLPLGKTDALFRLLPLTGCSPSPAFARVQFDLVSRLVRDVPCLTLRTGRDFNELPQRIRQVLS